MKYEIEINNEVKTVEVKNKQVILLLQGCPASGKSTFAEKLAQASKECDSFCGINKFKFDIVCRDDIRASKGIRQTDFSRENEVTDEEMSKAREILNLGYSLIVADTNLNPKYFHIWEELADEYDAELQKLLLYIPYWEAVKRDKARDRHVGHRAIERFYRQYFPNRLRDELTDKRPINESYNAMREDCIICDLDGTIALHQGRSPYEWDKIPTDKMDVRMARILKMYYDSGVNIIFLSGRPEHVYATTKEWLNKSFDDLGIDLDYQLVLRPGTDNRKGSLTKKDLYEKLIATYGYNTLCVFEDSNSCTEMWRSLGLLTCQVANGEY